MQTPIVVPETVGESSEVYLAQWLAAPGDEVASGEPLVVIEVDKAQVEVPAPVSGRLAGISAQVDDALVLGQVIGTIDAAAPDGG